MVPGEHDGGEALDRRHVLLGRIVRRGLSRGTVESVDRRHVLLGRIVRKGLDRVEMPTVGSPAWAERIYRQASGQESRARPWPLVLAGFGAACASASVLLAWLAPKPMAPVVAVAAPGTATGPARTSFGKPRGEEVARFSDGSVVTFRESSWGKLLGATTNAVRFELGDGRARFQLGPAAADTAAPSWLIQAGPYEIDAHGARFEVAWARKSDLLSLGLEGGRLRVRGPGTAAGAEGGVNPGSSWRTLQPGESLVARAKDGSLRVGEGTALAAALRPDEAVEGIAAALVVSPGGFGGPDLGAPEVTAVTTIPVAPGPDENGICPLRDSPTSANVPDPGPVSLATCNHVDPGATGKDVQARVVNDAWVKAMPGACLRYTEDARGNRIPDFSNAGYRSGGVPLPVVAAPAGTAPLLPSSHGDDTPAIQAALDAVGDLPPDSRGHRGAVELGAGVFTLRGPLRMSKSGVVLRGQGTEGPNATVLRGVGAPRTLIRVGGTGRRRPGRESLAVTDVYVPVGARSLTLERTGGLEVGDDVIVWRPKTQRWICAIGTDVVPANREGRANPPWRPTGAFSFERRIARIEGRRVTFDAPLTNALEREYTHAFITEMEFPERVSEIGVEHLVARGEFIGPGRCASPKSRLIRADALVNGWFRNVVGENLGGEVVSVGSGTKWITVTDVTWKNEKVADHDRCPGQIGFTLGGQQNLIFRSRTLGPHVAAVMSETEVEGPNAVVDFVAVGRNVRVRVASRWSSGFLFDNVRIHDGAGQLTGDFDLARGRDTFGWSAANSVLWNSEADQISVDSPPTAQNWVIGGQGRALLGTGIYSATHTPAQPQSLYRAQLAERLGRAALVALAPSTRPSTTLPPSLTAPTPGAPAAANAVGTLLGSPSDPAEPTAPTQESTALPHENRPARPHPDAR